MIFFEEHEPIVQLRPRQRDRFVFELVRGQTGRERTLFLALSLLSCLLDDLASLVVVAVVLAHQPGALYRGHLPHALLLHLLQSRRRVLCNLFL